MPPLTWKTALFIAIIVCLILMYKWSTYNTSTHENYLEGFWIADGDDFCEQAEIDSMLIYFGPSKPADGKRVKRECYVVITPDIENQAFTMSYKPTYASPALGSYELDCQIDFEEDALWDEKVKVAFDMRTGYLRIYSGETKWARVHKEHSL